MSSAWFPTSTMVPRSSTTILSARCTVLSRCAMTRVVRRLPAPSLTRRSSACCTTCSLLVSSAEVASSSSRTGGLRSTARAMATRCFCPPLSCPPRAPQWVAKPLGKPRTNSSALASFAACTIAASGSG
mmetsp:Transcript_17056/g.46807  ORF Transcript_17056/g.46807 Transcript_17056/m.46807 type:complete len:129 (+) Transcript_17056:2396-2782(+)